MSDALRQWLVRAGGSRTAALLVALLLWQSTPALAAGREFGGIGVQVVPTAVGDLVVLRVVEAAPATAALQPGDLIVEVDGFVLAGSDFAEVVPKRLWGAPGSSVKLKFRRPGVAGVQEVTLQRVPMQPGASQAPAVQMLKPAEGSEKKR